MREALTKRRIQSRAITRALLSVDELLAVTIAHLQKPGGNVTVRVVSFLGTTEVRIISRGSAFDSAEIRNAGAFRPDEDADEMENAVLGALFEQVMGDNLSVRNRSGANQIVLTVHRSKYRHLIFTLTALAPGLLAGIVLKRFLPADICAAVSTNVLAPVSTMFLNALGHSGLHTFYSIILAQAIPHILPAYRGEIVGLIKATAVVGYIAVQDLTKMGDIVRNRTYEAFFPLIAITIIYFVLEGLLGFAVSRIGVSFDPKRRSRARILKGVRTDD